MSDSFEEAQEQKAADGPAIGADEWVARSGARMTRRTGVAGWLERTVNRVPKWAQVTIAVALAFGFTFVASDADVHTGFQTLLYVLLALGLNVVVGWGGLLDLGYYAFYGFGAYAFAWLASDQFGKHGIHLPTAVAILIVVVATALLGLLVGLPSRRLVGDYLAIVTLFFGQIFTVLMVNGNNLFGVNFTNGANGIAGIDTVNIWGRSGPSMDVSNVRGYFWIALAMVVVVMFVLDRINRSRTGRAWRAMREDSLAAESMGMPVNWLKLMAFSFGAAVAGLAGTIFASFNVGVFPDNFTVQLLITVYAMVILGGAGSMTGVVVGAVLVSFLVDRLEYPMWARGLFYGLILLALFVRIRPWRLLAAVLGGTVVFGFVVRSIVHAIDPSSTGTGIVDSGSFTHGLSHWVVMPTELSGDAKGFLYVALIGALLGLTLLRGWRFYLALVPTLYLAAITWEDVMMLKPLVTRYILLGAILIVMMATRPEGLFGQKRVEIV